MVIRGRKRSTNSAVDWWFVSASGDESSRTGVYQTLSDAGLATGDSRAPVPTMPVPQCWSSQDDKVTFSARSGDTINLWRIGVSSATGKVIGPPERLTIGAGNDTFAACADKVVVFASNQTKNDTWVMPRDLTFLRRGGSIEFTLVLGFPEAPEVALGLLCYKLVLAFDKKIGIRVMHEILERVSGNAQSGTRLLGQTRSGKDFYLREVGTYTDSFQFGPERLALSLTPPDLQMYPSGNAVKEFLSPGVRYMQLNSVAMRQPAQRNLSWMEQIWRG
jgi:hypothetical protein